MILVWLIGVPLAGGLLAWAAGRISPAAARTTALAAAVFDLLLALSLLGVSPAGGVGPWLEFTAPWIPAAGISFQLALDGLSLVLVLLTAAVGVLAVIGSFSEITEKTGAFYFSLLAVQSGIIGVFLAWDLFLFYFFWELMLVPMVFLIGIWGHGNRVRAAVKFFLFTLIPGLLMLVAILALYFIHGAQTGEYTFSFPALLGTELAPRTAFWLMLGFFIGFAVKLPVFPIHTWLPDAHTEAPTAGSVILAALLLKTGAYGIIRFTIPLFPEASVRFVPVAMTLAVAGIIYGAVASFAQKDLKRLIAYSSVSHLGFVLLGIYSLNLVGYRGAVAGMVAHGVTSGALFLLAGMLYERCHTRELARFGGLWRRIPVFSAFLMLFSLATLGLPGLGNFVGEILALAGSFGRAPLFTAIAVTGLVAAPVYALKVVQQTVHGEPAQQWEVSDLRPREIFILAVLALAIFWLGIFPGPMLDTAGTPRMLTLTAPHLETGDGRAATLLPDEPAAGVSDGAANDEEDRP
jgi:NADH-quinone oxidoreductase subunit M